MRIAVIDCGTNTFNLLIADVLHGKIYYRFRTKRVVKLGENGISKGIIGDVPRERALMALKDFTQIIKQRKVEVVKAVGTAALRDAKNGTALLKKIKSATGLEIELIDGKQEANYIYEGVKEAISLGDRTSLIIDIGGGSVEFIIGNASKLFWKKSFRIGAARLIEDFQPSDPINKPEILSLNQYLLQQLEPMLVAVKKYQPDNLIGSSGSFDTFAAIIMHSQGTPNRLKRETTYQFKLSEYKLLHKELVQSTYKERLKMPGMLRMRADMIMTASLLLTFVLHETGIKKLSLSTYALKEGLMKSLVQ
ncbi:hypothetical protein BH11BAC2_BH11BAC2_16920 [soil metagenome]